MAAQTLAQSQWGSDFFGTLNEMPPEPVATLGGVLEIMASFPPFRDARQWVLHNLGLSPGAAVLEGGCGNGIALAELLDIVGQRGQIVGVDPTKAFIEAARRRTQERAAANARYEVGDIRKLPSPANAFDAAFCDKVLIHAGPAPASVGELARVTKPGGSVGVVDWMPFFVLSTTREPLAEAFNAVMRKALYDYYVSANLARHFHAVGLSNVRVKPFLAHTDNLDAHPFWRTFIVEQLPMFVQAGLIEEKTAAELAADLEMLSRKGEFSASFIIQGAVGRKPA
jgi:ubiquinone/menaquinone biosynthesis C-methylase UbiE